jgi:hypothetical protein
LQQLLLVKGMQHVFIVSAGSPASEYRVHGHAEFLYTTLSVVFFCVQLQQSPLQGCTRTDLDGSGTSGKSNSIPQCKA